jgi:hypothetical protein
MMVENNQIRKIQMKIYRLKDIENPCISKEDLEKIAILKLCGPGEYMKGVGIRDDQFFVLAEDENDKLYLKEMKK